MVMWPLINRDGFVEVLVRGVARFVAWRKLETVQESESQRRDGEKKGGSRGQPHIPPMTPGPSRAPPEERDKAKEEEEEEEKEV